MLSGIVGNYYRAAIPVTHGDIHMPDHHDIGFLGKEANSLSVTRQRERFWHNPSRPSEFLSLPRVPPSLARCCSTDSTAVGTLLAAVVVDPVVWMFSCYVYMYHLLLEGSPLRTCRPKFGPAAGALIPCFACCTSWLVLVAP